MIAQESRLFVINDFDMTYDQGFVTYMEYYKMKHSDNIVDLKFK